MQAFFLKHKFVAAIDGHTTGRDFFWPSIARGADAEQFRQLTGEMAELLEEGVDGIVCAQPFACLPNHIVGKGVIQAIRTKYPKANITAIDYDPGASEVNQLNRIKLMISIAKENIENELKLSAD